MDVARRESVLMGHQFNQGKEAGSVFRISCMERTLMQIDASMGKNRNQLKVSKAMERAYETEPRKHLVLEDDRCCCAKSSKTYKELGKAAIYRLLSGPVGYLDEQFCQVEDLQDEDSPNFVQEVVTLFFKDSARLMSNIEQALEKYPRDFNRWDAYMQQLKGSCSSIGASRMKNECMSFRDNCGQGNVEGCMRSFQKVKREHAVLRQKLESYFQLLRQACPAGAATRPVM